MANFDVLDAGGETYTFKSTNTAGVETPHHNSQLMTANAHVTNTNPVSSILVNRHTANDWFYVASAGGVANTDDVIIAANAGDDLKNYVVSIQIENTHATVNTEVVLKSASTVIWRGFLRANAAVPTPFTFDPAISTDATDPLNFACLTTGANVYINAQGYIAP